MQKILQPTAIPAEMPDVALPDADWADCFAMIVNRGDLSPEQAAKLAFGYVPKWITALLALRNTLMKPLGLISTRDPKKPSDAGMPTQTIGFFPVVSNGLDRIVLGFDDWHLDFRIVVTTKAVSDKSEISVTTLIKRHNIFGRFYLMVVTPFHKIIVPTMMKSIRIK